MSTRFQRSSRFMLVFALLLMLSAGLMPAVAQEGDGPARVGLRPDAPTYAVHGPYWVGTREFVIDPDSERPLPVTVWYPALNPEGMQETIDYEVFPGYAIAGRALSEADADSVHGPYPLVILSHGSWYSRLGYAYLTEHLASYGFAVVAIDHTGNTMQNAGQDRASFWVYRPLDVRRAIDFAADSEAQNPLADLIDLEHVALVGHSFGGVAALLGEGARLDWVTLTEVCTQASEDIDFCALVRSGAQLARIAGLDSLPTGLWPSMGDPRVDAIAAFAPGGTDLFRSVFGDHGLDNLRSPALIMQGTADIWAGPADAEYVYQHLNSAQKSYVALDVANHAVFMTACNALPPAASADMTGFPWCSDQVWDMDRAHDLINHFTTAFLLDVLKGDAEAHAALLPDAVSFPGITYETTMH